MFTDNTLKTPYRNFPTHKIISDALYFIPKEEFNLGTRNETTDQTPVLQKDTKLLILEHGVGLKAEWCKVKLEDERIGYIKFINALEALEGTLPFYGLNTKEDYLPNVNKPKINWKTQKINVVYDDEYNGAFVVHANLENVVQFSDENALAAHMETARRIGLKLILEHAAIKTTEQDFEKLFTNYYSFCTAEDWYLDPRPCSTLRVAVTIPKRYLYAKSVLVKDASLAPPPETPIQIPPDNQFVLKFTTYTDYKFFFDRLIDTLGRYNFTYIQKLWTTDPEGGVSLDSEINQIKSFVNSTNTLLARNHPNNFVSSNILGIPDLIGLEPKYWTGSLEIVIDKNKLEILSVKYHSSDSDISVRKNYSLINGYISYLKSIEVTNQTTVNYLVNFDPVKDFYDPFAKTVEDVKNFNLEKALKNIEQFVSSGCRVQIPAFGPDEDLKKFLTSKHYPKINDIQAVPLDLSECLTDSTTRVNDLLATKLPSEIKKWKDLKNVYNINKVEFEGDYFTKNLQALKKNLSPDVAIKDPNLRILFGIDKLEGKSAQQKLFTYLNIANTIDWGKYVGVASQCLMVTLPPDVISCLLAVYKGAAKFLESLAFATACNPFLKNALKFINGISLPTIEVYNSSEVLARELEAAFYRILTDLVSALLKAALQAAAKACAGNPKQNFNGGSGSPNNPFDSANNDPAINDVLDDAFKSLGNNPNITSPVTRDEVKQKIKEIIDDMTVCLSTRELCGLYNGRTVSDEAILVVISLIKRKYGSPYSELFSTRESVINFFMSLGRRMDLSICQDILLNADVPYAANPNILCDDGKLVELRQSLLADHGLTPALIDDLLNKIRLEEAKALEDVLKLLNSPNPLDFSSFPDLTCKVFPSGVSVAPTMNEFGDLLNGLTDHLYDNFDNEAPEWHKTTYSIKNLNSPNLLVFNKDTGQIEVNKDIKIDDKVSQNIRANSGKEDKATQEKNSNIETVGEVKLPAYIFKDTIKDSKPSLKTLSSGNSPITYFDSLNGFKQQQLDINFITDTLRDDISKGEQSLSLFGSKLIAYINGKFISSLIESGIKATQSGLAYSDFKDRIASSNNSSEVKDILSDVNKYDLIKNLISDLTPVNRFIYLLSVFLNNTPDNSEQNSSAYKELYDFFEISKAEESNSFFAKETGATIYLVLGKFLFEDRAWDGIKNDLQLRNDDPVYNTLKILYDNAFGDYNTIKNYYKAIVNLKVNYPDYDINYLTGLNRVQYLISTTASLNTASVDFQNMINNGSADFGKVVTIDAYRNNTLYDLQRMEVARNKTNYIKFTEITKVNSVITDYISGTLQIIDPSELNKPNLFFKYLLKKMETYGQGNTGITGTAAQLRTNIVFNPLVGGISGLPSSNTANVLTADLDSYQYVNQKLFDHVKAKISSVDNKFIHLKDTRNPYIATIAESGSGIPYTKYLKLVIPQSLQQKLCNVRPHYLDIDSIKKDITDEKSQNMCVEKATDNRTVGPTPISTDELEHIERTNTQNAMLRGMYRLAVRVFLHDIVLRGIPLFGVYDPQSLRDEPAFITFVSKLAESEIRGIDNTFFYMLSGFLLKEYMDANPNDQIENEKGKRSELFRELVKDEIQKFVLTKLAKRIGSDTNIELLTDIPKNSPIRLVNILEDLKNATDVLTVSGNSVYLNTNISLKNGQLTPNNLEPTKPLGPQKIFQDGPDDQDAETTFKKFLATPDFDFLFKYIFPSTQILNYFFALSCLSTGTRKQIVNSFMGTKREVIQLCKTIAANGQRIAPNPNDIQSADVDPIMLVIGELLKSMLTTPIKILKGVAESSEPNIAVTSTVFKLARSFVPELPSIMIPAASLPLGLFPTPITCPLPFINPLLAAAYFATLGWFDEKESKKAGKALEDLFNSRGKAKCDDVINQDLFYTDNTPIELSAYSASIDYNALTSLYAPIQINEVSVDNLATSGLQAIENEFAAEALSLFNDVISQTYTYNKAVNITNTTDTTIGQNIINYDTVNITEQLSQFMNEYNDHDLFLEYVKNAMRETEDEINTPVGSEKAGTFVIVKESVITYARPFLMGLIPALRSTSEYSNWTEAYNAARNIAKNKAIANIVTIAKQKRDSEYVTDTTPEEGRITPQQATQQRIANRQQSNTNVNTDNSGNDGNGV